DEAVNAWCLPGGKIGLTTGLFPSLQDETGLAMILSHNVAHALLRHGAERISDKLKPEVIGALLAAPLGSGDPSAQRTVLACYGGVPDGGPALPFDRAQESEADRLGLELMARAGFDPRQAIDVWKRLSSIGEGRAMDFLAIHPIHPGRV